MSLFAIGDLHLSLSADKPMDIFGSVWRNHPQKLMEGFSALTAEDTCVLCGDLSWGMGIEDCREDFAFIHSLPGKKILVKGNHDYWWSTAAKINGFLQENGFSDFSILHNNCIPFGEYALCGTRGWFDEEEKVEIMQEMLYFIFDYFINGEGNIQDAAGEDRPGVL